VEDVVGAKREAALELSEAALLSDVEHQAALLDEGSQLGEEKFLLGLVVQHRGSVSGGVGHEENLQASAGDEHRLRGRGLTQLEAEGEVRQEDQGPVRGRGEQLELPGEGGVLVQGLAVARAQADDEVEGLARGLRGLQQVLQGVLRAVQQVVEGETELLVSVSQEARGIEAQGAFGLCQGLEVLADVLLRGQLYGAGPLTGCTAPLDIQAVGRVQQVDGVQGGRGHGAPGTGDREVPP
jgi:hypothetical protein